ncbi:hypothetical protein KOW79_015686 [Hemibagrus wyckioides]|uniref:Uncharacterized protein n=1 Tax=Hemibagrus wyckioides TaxID=337641 RepID=A0A9D3NEJ7_9TELE|nr:hypothetical protein KOW79_015686 [Hemibagrus wyckioides]
MRGRKKETFRQDVNRPHPELWPRGTTPEEKEVNEQKTAQGSGNRGGPRCFNQSLQFEEGHDLSLPGGLIQIDDTTRAQTCYGLLEEGRANVLARLQSSHLAGKTTSCCVKKGGA